MKYCNISKVGKHRNGKPKFWCKTHFALASESNAKEPLKCDRHDQPPISEGDKYVLSPEDWEGGVGIWGALDPVYDTSPYDGHQSGIHLHTRVDEEGPKQIDYTFKEILVKTPDSDLFGERLNIALNTEIAHAYTASMVFGKKMKYLKCTHCGQPHIDAEYFAVTPHKKHMCTYCGRGFIDDEKGIANPVVEIQRIFQSTPENRTIKLVDEVLDIKQKDYPGGIQIWGSNPAIIWTANRPEEAGIHVHVYSNEKGQEAFEDDTFGKVLIDGIELNEAQVRYLMVQKALPHLEGKIKSLFCPNPECTREHFDRADFGIRPHSRHRCHYCKQYFTSKMKCVSNPIIDVFKQLKENYESLQK